MSAFKGTPGPWSYCGCTRGGCVCGLVFGGEHAVATTTLDHDEELSSHQPGEAAKRANARLIAAAPELLSCLDMTAHGLEVASRVVGGELGAVFSDRAMSARAAIAKATGGDA